MAVKNFLKRRFISLHPMVVMGAIIGAIMFYTQECSVWNVSTVTIGALLIGTFLNALLIPATPGIEVRGIGEMFPLNGPNRSLFFEYIANILYSLFIRKFSTTALAIFVFLAGSGLAAFAIFGSLGDICVGHSLTGTEFTGGIFRLLFSFSTGMLQFRIFKPIKIKGALWICSTAIIALLAIPHIGGYDHLWMNGIYDTLCVVLLFPLLVHWGASGKTAGKLRVLGRYLLSTVYGTLSFYLPLLCLGKE